MTHCCSLRFSLRQRERHLRLSLMNQPPPTLPSVSPAAALYAMRRDPLSFFTKMAAEQGDIARFRLGDHEHDLYLLNHPDYIKEVLVTQDRNFTNGSRSIGFTKCSAKGFS
jgi:cytochrome P450